MFRCSFCIYNNLNVLWFGLLTQSTPPKQDLECNSNSNTWGEWLLHKENDISDKFWKKMFPGVLLVFGMFYRTSVSALCWKNSNGRQVKPSADIYSRRSDVIYRHIWSRLLCSRALTCSEITLLKKEQKLQTLHKINNKWLKCSKRISRPISLSPPNI